MPNSGSLGPGSTGRGQVLGRRKLAGFQEACGFGHQRSEQALPSLGWLVMGRGRSVGVRFSPKTGRRGHDEAFQVAPKPQVNNT